MKPFQRIITAVLLLVLLCAFTNTRKEVVVEGVCVGAIKLGMSVTEAAELLHDEPKLITWNQYSYEHYFQRDGISLFEMQGDEQHEIFAITIHPDRWKGYTQMGLKVNRRLRIKDVLAVYGEPEWGYTMDCSTVDAEYEDVGIYFTVNPREGLCDSDDADHNTVYFEERVSEFTIGVVGTAY
ncbi:hypothetical protein [Gilvibacter sp.]|uniref:hypothetical protein n=1 Tax=Gilvibacter sp. TaxID=2729997 RepID=UPI003F49C9B5